MKDCLEAKLFGIGLESYTVGSYDFYAGYCSSNKVICTLDTGHFVPTESVADKVSSLLLFVPELMLHVSRPIRWDSDHVTIMNDDTMDLFKEIVRAEAMDRADSRHDQTPQARRKSRGSKSKIIGRRFKPDRECCIWN